MLIIMNDNILENLHMMQISDSFFPTGLFATSNGIETLFYEKKISTALELLELNKVMIEQQLGSSECIILANAFECARKSDYEKIIELDEICCSMRTNKETRKASIRSGKQLVRCVKEFLDKDKTLNWYDNSIQEGKTIGMYSISFGICSNAMQIRKEKVLTMFLYGFVISNIGASLRLGMIQHFEGQKLIHELKPLIVKTVNENINKPISDICQFMPQIEIFQMYHEKTDSSMFMT